MVKNLCLVLLMAVLSSFAANGTPVRFASVAETDYAEEFSNFLINLSFGEWDAVSEVFTDQDQFAYFQKYICTPDFVNALAKKNYSDCTENYQAGELIQQLEINYIETDQDTGSETEMVVYLTFQETDEGLRIIDYFVPERN